MNLSLDEFRALVAKAFRGAGYSWGLTEEGSFAARRLAEFGLPSGDMVVRLLRQVDGSAVADVMPDDAWVAAGGTLCPVCVGASISDLGGCADLVLGATIEPLFIAPFLAETLDAAKPEGYEVTWLTGRCMVAADSISVTGELPEAPVEVTIERFTDLDAAESQSAGRVELSNETMAALEHLAHRVYAPATEASRLAGAGAGLRDDD